LDIAAFAGAWSPRRHNSLGAKYLVSIFPRLLRPAPRDKAALCWSTFSPRASAYSFFFHNKRIYCPFIREPRSQFVEHHAVTRNREYTKQGSEPPRLMKVENDGNGKGTSNRLTSFKVEVNGCWCSCRRRARLNPRCLSSRNQSLLALGHIYWFSLCGQNLGDTAYSAYR
jgi:hypothetical protein